MWACVLFLCWKKWNELSKEMIIHSNLYWKVVLQRPLTFDTFENCYQRNLLTNKILSKTLEIEFDKVTGNGHWLNFDCERAKVIERNSKVRRSDRFVQLHCRGSDIIITMLEGFIYCQIKWVLFPITKTI